MTSFPPCPVCGSDDIAPVFDGHEPGDPWLFDCLMCAPPLRFAESDGAAFVQPPLEIA